MSSGWFGRALASAKDAASLGGVLTSVAEAANDRVKRVGQALHARVTGRHSFEDAVRLEPALEPRAAAPSPVVVVRRALSPVSSRPTRRTR